MTTAQIEQSEVRDAAEAMLAALIDASEMLRDMNASQNGPLESRDRKTEARIHAAIAAAHAAGIRVKD